MAWYDTSAAKARRAQAYNNMADIERQKGAIEAQKQQNLANIRTGLINQATNAAMAYLGHQYAKEDAPTQDGQKTDNPTQQTQPTQQADTNSLLAKYTNNDTNGLKRQKWGYLNLNLS